MAAFDDALLQAGIANYNLLRLSSVIPPGSEVVETTKAELPAPGAWGDRLYIVSAEAYATEPGQEAWAGIGWVQEPETGKGLFVEHVGLAEEQVHSAIDATTAAMLHGRSMDGLPIMQRRIGATCDHKDRPVCALVAAVYKAAGWDTK